MSAQVDVLDNLVRGRRANLDDALATGQVELVEGDLRDRDLVHDLTRGKDLVFHQAAIRITQCAEEPRLALEVLVDGTFNVLEAAADHGVDKLVAASSASVYGLAEEFPTTERHHHHNNDTFYGAAKSFNEGMVRSFRAMYGLDYVLLRYFNVYGPRMDVHGLYTEVLVRWMERIADGQPPLIFGDGLQTMDFVYTRDIARANILAAGSDVSEGVYNIASGDGDQPARTGPGTAARHGLRPAGRARPGPCGQRRHPAAGGHLRGPARPRLHGRDRARGRAARAGRLVAPAAQRDRRLPVGGRAVTSQPGAALSRINVMQPWLGTEEVDAVARGDRVRLGGPGSAGGRSSRRPSPPPSRSSTPSPSPAAPRRCTWRWSWRASARATTSSCPSFSFIATANAAGYVGARPVFATSTR